MPHPRNRRSVRSLTGDEPPEPLRSAWTGPGAARHHGICHECDRSILPGDAIRRTRRGYVHRLCGSGGDDE